MAKKPIKKVQSPKKKKQGFVNEFEQFSDYMEFKVFDIAKIKGFEGNPRYMPEEGHKRIQHSMKRFKWTAPVLLWTNPKDKTYEILAGHQRVTDATAIGATKAPCIILKQFTTKSEAMSYVIADNQLSNLSTWDMPLLKDWVDELEGVEGFDISDTGFSAEELDTMFREDLPDWDPLDPVGPEDSDDEKALMGRVVVKVKEPKMLDTVKDLVEELVRENFDEDQVEVL